MILSLHCEIAVHDYQSEQEESAGLPSQQPLTREYQPWVTQLPVRLRRRSIAQDDDLLVWMHHTFGYMELTACSGKSVSYLYHG